MGIPFTYELSDVALQVYIGPWLCSQISYSDIERAEIRAFHVQFGLMLKLSNIWPIQTRLILIHRKSGVIRKVLISPSMPETFLKELESRQKSVS